MNRAAVRARRHARAKRRDFLRRNARVIGTTVFTVSIALLMAIAIIPSLPRPAMVLAAAALLLVLIRLARLARMPGYTVSAGLASEWTAQEFRRLARLGWRVFADVEWNGTTIEHVAAGPAGVLAVNTAIANTPWRVSPDGLEGPEADVLTPARTAANALADLLAATGVRVKVIPTLVVWGPGAPLYMNGQEVVHGVAVLIGRQAPEWRVDLRGRNLDDATLERIADTLANPITAPSAPRALEAPGRKRSRGRALARA